MWPTLLLGLFVASVAGWIVTSYFQGQEITYRNVQGTHKTEFKVIGDDYFDDGQVIAWRCLLISNGRIVAENRSFMWE